MNNFAKFLAVAVALAVPTLAAHADPLPYLSGAISIGGSVNTTNISSEVEFVTSNGSDASTATGDFINLFPCGATDSCTTSSEVDSVALSSFTYSTVNSGGSDIFTVDTTGSLGDLTFDLTSVSENVSADGDFYLVTGSGFLEDAGYANTPGTFLLSASDNGVTNVSFQASAVTPEPSSLLLLGTGLLGSAGVLYRRSRSSVV